MQAHHAITLAHEWLTFQLNNLPPLVGAHLVGSLAHLENDAPFPKGGDIDIHLVTNKIPNIKSIDTQYNGTIIECAFYPSRNYRNAQAILSHPYLAAHFCRDNILLDPSGKLKSIQSMVCENYAQKHWIKHRYFYIKNRLHTQFRKFYYYSIRPSYYSFSSELTWIRLISDLLATATLQPPTIRRCLILLRNALGKEGRTIYEDLLEALGYAHISDNLVTDYLNDLSDNFDLAVKIKHNPPIFLARKLHPHVKPYHIHGIQNMVKDGNHREAMYWVLSMSHACNLIIQRDAPYKQRLYSQQQFDKLLKEIGHKPELKKSPLKSIKHHRSRLNLSLIHI